MTPHDLRHPKVIQGRLGHASIRTTLDTYGHLMEGLDEAAAELLDGTRRQAAADTLRTPGGQRVVPLQGRASESQAP